MQRDWLITIATALLVAQSWAVAGERLSNGFTQNDEARFRAGFWWDPDNPNWGVDLHMAGPTLILTWATYDERGQPTWYLGTAQASGDRFEVPLNTYQWNGSAAQPKPAGHVVLTFDDGYHAQMNWVLGDRSGQYDIQPFVVDERPLSADRTGFWYRPSESGYGMSVVTQGAWLMTVFYFYDGAGAARWVWGDNGGGIQSDLTLLGFTGACPGCAPGDRQTNAVGTLSLNLTSENAGSVAASIELSSPLAGRWETALGPIALLSDRPSGRAEAFELAPFSGPDLLEAYLKEGLLYPNGYRYSLLPDSVNFSPAAPVAAFSTTNLQETGVDEADLVKSDGRYLYTLDPADFHESVHRLRTYAIGEDAADVHALANIELKDNGTEVGGMYLLAKGSGLERDLLVVVFGGGYAYYSPTLWFAPEPWTEAQTEIYVFDIDDPATPKEIAHIQFDGLSTESRRIGTTLYTVSRARPKVPPGLPGTSDVAALLAQTPLAALLPQLSINGLALDPLVDSQAVLLPPQPVDFRYTDMITVSAFDLAHPTEHPKTLTFVGIAESVYMSLQNLYIASSRFGYGVDPAFGSSFFPYQVNTDIHQFELNGEDIAYRGSGEVDGYLSHAGPTPAFAFSEHAGHLRVVTAGLGEFNDEYRLSVLSLALPQSPRLQVVGSVPNAQRPQKIGKPGDILHGLRFLDERLYAVTFKKTDPLYVLNLSAPSDPYIAGELEIPGFSDYLHPLPGNWLLGFGKGAVDAEGPGDGDFAWFQGLQLSLFDTTDASHPSLVGRIDLGRRGSQSSLLHDHHAFSFLAEDLALGRPARVAIPVVVHDAKSAADLSPLPQHFYAWQYSGLAMFELPGLGDGQPDLILREVLTTHRSENDPAYPSWMDALPSSGRSVLSDRNAYFYLNGALFSAPWGAASPVAGPF